MARSRATGFSSAARKFATPLARDRRVEEVKIIRSVGTSRHQLRELEDKFIEADVPAARVYTVKDICKDPHSAEREMLLEMPGPDLGSVTVTGVVPKLGATPG